MKLNPIHGLLGVLGAGAGLWFWSEKRKTRPATINTAVLNNPPPQNAVVLGAVYNYKVKPVVGMTVPVFSSAGSPVGELPVVWVQSPEGNKPPTIVVKTSTASIYATPAPVG